MCIVLKDFYLGTPMNLHEHVWINIGHIDPHMFMQIHWCDKVKILEDNTHESATLG